MKNIKLLSALAVTTTFLALASCGKKKDNPVEKTSVIVSSEDVSTSTSTSTSTITSTSTSTSTNTNTSTSTSTSTLTQTLTVPSMNTYKVDKDTFDSYFGVDSIADLSNLNYKVEFEYNISNFSKSGYIEIDGTSVFEDTNVNGTNHKFLYYDFKLNKQDSSCLNFIEKVFNNNQWQDAATSNPRSFNEFISGYLCLENFRYTDFTFNSETRCYEADRITSSKNTYKNVSISFDDNKITSFSAKFTTGSSTTEGEISYTYSNVGKTSVENPFLDK